MEFIAELLFELILDGSVEILGSRKVPVFLRILAGFVVGFVYAALITLSVQLAVSGYQGQDWALLTVGAAMTALFAVFGILLWRKLNKLSNKQGDQNDRC